MPEEQESAERSGGNGMASGFSQTTEAIEKLRGVVDQATHAIKDLTQLSEQWAQQAQERAREVAKQLGEQSNRAVGTVSETVEHNPLASLAIAFAVGFAVARLIRR